MSLPTDSKSRKDIPLCRGVLDYFPLALAAVARVSKKGNDKHNPGEPIHWARDKSTDQSDAIVRHLIERGGVDAEDGEPHSAHLAWRALALCQIEMEERAKREAIKEQQPADLYGFAMDEPPAEQTLEKAPKQEQPTYGIKTPHPAPCTFPNRVCGWDKRTSGGYCSWCGGAWNYSVSEPPRGCYHRTKQFARLAEHKAGQ
jgi:hypothetical protein